MNDPCSIQDFVVTPTLTPRPVLVFAGEHAASRSTQQSGFSRILRRLSESVDAKGERLVRSKPVAGG
jgi:hypothetical protein